MGANRALQIEPTGSEELHDFRSVERVLSQIDHFELDELDRFDVVFVQSSYFRKHQALLNALLRSTAAQKVILDDEASTTRCAFGAAPLVNLYVKKQVLRNFDDYRYQYRSQRIHAYLVDAAEGEARRPGPLEVPDAFRDKLYTGWNIGTSKSLRSLLQRCEAAGAHPTEPRPIDISMRISVDIQEHSHWYYRHRQRALESLLALGDSFRVHASKQIVASDHYYRELGASKICLSPWGYGEICYRDFEAIMYGALLVKPPMDHLLTNPNVYRPGETFVQVRADFSNLGEVCAYYLDHGEERRCITQAALAAYRAYFSERTFLEQMGEILARLRGSKRGAAGKAA